MLPNNPSVHGFKKSVHSREPTSSKKSTTTTTTTTTTSFTCGKKPPTGIHPHSQNTFLSSGFWVPSLTEHKHEKVKNVKRVLKSPETIPSSNIATSKDLKTDRRPDDNFRFNKTKYSRFDDEKQVSTFLKEFSQKRQNPQNKNISTDADKSSTKFASKTNESSSEGTNHVANGPADNFNHSNQIQYTKHMRQTSANIYSNFVSPFHNLNYCRKTNLNQTKCCKSQYFEVPKVKENKNEPSDEKKDESKATNQESSSMSRDDVPDDPPEKRKERNQENLNSGNKLHESNFIDIPQLKMRAGSLTETIRPNENEEEFEGSGRRMRGLSLSASCLPFKPFQLQKPNLPWNRVSSVSTTNSMDRKYQQESFKNYVHVNIRTEKSTNVNHAKKRLESLFQVDDVRHSLPVLWKSGIFPKKDESSCDDFSTSAESLYSVSTKCSIPSIQISLFDSTEDVGGSIKITPVESPVSRSSSNESIKAHTPTPDYKADQNRIPPSPSSSSSPSSPPPPVPPRNKSLYQNFRYTSTIKPEIRIDRNKQVIISGGDTKDDESNDDRSSPQLIYDFKLRESQDYVMARIKHEKSQDNHEVTNSHQSAIVMPRQIKSEIISENNSHTQNDNDSKGYQNSEPSDVKSKPPGKKVPENLHLSPKLLAPDIAQEPLPSPDEKLKNFVIPCLWFSSTPYDRLLISILDPRNSELNKASCWENYMRLLQPYSPDSSTKSFSYETTSFSSLNNSLDSSNGSSSKFSLPQSPMSPFFRSKFSTFIPEEQIVEGSEAHDASNNTIVDSVHTIVSNYHELESRMKKLLSAKTDRKTQERFSMLLEQMDTALQLIAKLTDQMTKLSSDSITFKDHTRQNRLIEKLAEARDLKMKIDRKGEQLAAKIKQNIDQKSFEMLEFLLRARTYVMLLNRSNFISARRKASNPSVLLSPN